MGHRHASARIPLRRRHGESAPELVKIGTGEDITIAEFARVVAATIGFRGEITFDNSRPDGTPRKLLDISRAYEPICQGSGSTSSVVET